MIALEKSNIAPKIDLDYFSWENSANTTRDVFEKVLNEK
jgi:hypothetical protein